MSDIRDSKTSIRRGTFNRCPNCGEGRLFDGYLKIVDRCDNCGAPLGNYPAADGPAFFTMTIVMLLLIPLIGFGWVLFKPEPVTFLIVLSILITIITLVLLRFVKGAFVGYLWAKDEIDRGS
ncbi:DUF983 domain-containing protein [Paracoccus sp. 11-3]|uniref:DUF983 domain-containing protein n=1 Tax=Paracoccus amoyensis TaxID=2760093 RepID=A0A926GCN9_9RHOB|nr:DUF983 domain-containing protein [Paracoccus amoyensis]MBC9247566.1 DUF983 domain-containing protein [Paracoccus amoyensis]